MTNENVPEGRTLPAAANNCVDCSLMLPPVVALSQCSGPARNCSSASSAMPGISASIQPPSRRTSSTVRIAGIRKISGICQKSVLSPKSVIARGHPAATEARTLAAASPSAVSTQAFQGQTPR